MKWNVPAERLDGTGSTSSFAPFISWIEQSTAVPAVTALPHEMERAGGEVDPSRRARQKAVLSSGKVVPYPRRSNTHGHCIESISQPSGSSATGHPREQSNGSLCHNLRLPATPDSRERSRPFCDESGMARVHPLAGWPIHGDAGPCAFLLQPRDSSTARNPSMERILETGGWKG